MRRFGGEIESKQDGRVDPLRYMNFSLTNTTSRLLRASISNFADDNVLSDPSKYLASVVRFDLNARTIPITIVEVTGPISTLPPHAGEYPTAYGVALSFRGVDYAQQLFWIPPTVPPPELPLGTIYDYAEWLVAFNSAYALAFADMIADVGPIPGVSSPPYLSYDPSTQLISLYMQEAYFSPVLPNTDPVTIWTNAPAYTFLASMPAAVSGTGLPNYKDVELSPAKFAGPSRFSIPAAGLRVGYPSDLSAVAGAVVQTPQQAISVSGWNVCRSIVITSPNLNACVEGIPLNNAASKGLTVSNNFQSVVSDFLMNPDDNPVAARQTVVYLPTAEYRLFCMSSNSAIKQIDLQFFWNDFQNRQHPIYLAPGSSCSVKLMFRTREYNGLD